MQQIVTKTDGVPLFVEELTKSVVEQHGGAKDISPFHLGIPATLQDALMARLDRLAPVREIAQLGAILGREFSYELLHAVANQDESRLRQGLRQLVEAELLYQRGLPPHATYLFKHALIQDTAYQSLLKRRRQQLHRHIAHVLETQFAETKETQPELLAHHYTEAGLIEQAIPYWQKAGKRATQRSAYVEAVAHLTKGLGLLKTLTNTPEHVQQELTLQLSLNDALFAVKGYAAPDAEKAVTRARELCQQLGETPQLFSMLVSLWTFYYIRGQVQTAHELAKQMMHLAQSSQGQYLLALAHFALGCTLYQVGDLTSAWLHLEQAIELYDPQKHPLGSVDLRIGCLSFAAWTLWNLGYPEQALQRSQEAVAVAEGLSHPLSLAFALGNAASFHIRCREGQLARERAEATIELCTEQGFPYWLVVGTIWRGGAQTQQGQEEEGITQIRQGLDDHRVLGEESGLTSGFAPLAEAYGKVGQIEEGLTILAEALAHVDKTGERFYEAELYRIKGELTLESRVESHKSKVEEAEADFLKAIEIARRQQAKSLELRATVSLARLWQQQGKQAEACSMLSTIYHWFTEGFDTKDLQDAKALLEELEEGGR